MALLHYMAIHDITNTITLYYTQCIHAYIHLIGTFDPPDFTFTSPFPQGPWCTSQRPSRQCPQHFLRRQDFRSHMALICPRGTEEKISTSCPQFHSTKGHSGQPTPTYLRLGNSRASSSQKKYLAPILGLSTSHMHGQHSPTQLKEMADFPGHQYFGATPWTTPDPYFVTHIPFIVADHKLTITYHRDGFFYPCF